VASGARLASKKARTISRPARAGNLKKGFCSRTPE